MVWAVSLWTTKLSPRRLTDVCAVLALVVCLGLVTCTRPLAQTVRYLQDSRDHVAVPQYISGRTSFRASLKVRVLEVEH